MKTLWFCLFLLAVAPIYGQPPTVQPDPPFRLNFQVSYTGSKAHPELAALLYKSLRALPGVGIVDRDPDAILIVNENLNGNQYACSFTILTPRTPFLRSQLKSVLDDYQAGQRRKEELGETTDKDSQVISLWPAILTATTKTLTPTYSYEGGIVSINPSAKVALALAVKSLDMGFVEKERREYDYSLAHPVKLDPPNPPPPIYDPTPPPTPKPTPVNLTMPRQEIQLATPTGTPYPLLGPDPFPKKP